MEFDDLLTHHIGPFGRYQALVSIAYFFSAFPYFVAVKELIFQGVVPRHYCNDTYPNNLLKTKWNLTDIDIFKITAPSKEYESGKQCHMIGYQWENISQNELDVLLTSNSSGLVPQGDLLPCRSHIYNDTEFGITILEHVSILRLINFLAHVYGYSLFFESCFLYLYTPCL